MNASVRLKPQKGDLLAAALVFLLAAVLFVFLPGHMHNAENVSVEIYQNGTLIRKLSLETDQSFDITGAYTNTVTVHDGKIAITHSTCPGSDCVHSGWADSAGQAIVCLPNKTEVRLIGAQNEDGVDAIAG